MFFVRLPVGEACSEMIFHPTADLRYCQEISGHGVTAHYNFSHLTRNSGNKEYLVCVCDIVFYIRISPMVVLEYVLSVRLGNMHDLVLSSLFDI